MDITEIKDKKKILEKDIAIILMSFEKSTGINITGIEIKKMDMPSGKSELISINILTEIK